MVFLFFGVLKDEIFMMIKSWSIERNFIGVVFLDLLDLLELLELPRDNSCKTTGQMV